jgi:hypothetical protein
MRQLKKSEVYVSVPGILAPLITSCLSHRLHAIKNFDQLKCTDELEAVGHIFLLDTDYVYIGCPAKHQNIAMRKEIAIKKSFVTDCGKCSSLLIHFT